MYNRGTVTPHEPLPDEPMPDVRSTDGKVLFVAFSVTIGCIVALLALVFLRVSRPDVDGDDVSDRPEFTAVREQIAGLDACAISYGQHTRGMHADERRYGYLYVRECGERWSAVNVSLERADWQRGVTVALRRSSRSAPWSIYVDKGSAPLPAVVSALDRFAAILVARYPTLLIEQRAEMSRARRDLEQQQQRQQSERDRNASSWR